MTKLTWMKVNKIRKLYAEGVYSRGDIADMFNIKQGTVGQIIRCETWRYKHADE